MKELIKSARDLRASVTEAVEKGTSKEVIEGGKKYKVVTDKGGTKFWYLNGKYHREDGPAVEYANGDKLWYINGKHHREDGPACEYADGTKSWYINGKLHREDGPAIELANGDKSWYLNGDKFAEEDYWNEVGPDKKRASVTEAAEKGATEEVIEGGKKYKVVTDKDGTKRWYLNGKRHREKGPAIEYANGDKLWYLNDKLHRKDGPAVENANGDKFWYLNDLLHREDGPAVENTNGNKYWFINGERHREDGPAIEFANGDKEWYINGDKFAEEDYWNEVGPDKMRDYYESHTISATPETNSPKEEEGGKTTTNEAKEAKAPDEDEEFPIDKNKNSYDVWIDLFASALEKNKKRPEFVKAIYQLERYVQAYPSTIRVTKSRSALVEHLFNKMFKAMDVSEN